ncbi:metallophosphoesterase [Mucilaginibacter sp. ZT4R22]|uniref:Metallophosphoesterase n=1 Tax=Mucilaginibacter pankratovii TaxID=2772110 RepID=A0ABR7WK48_9SPHI|nr:metallophosphoesterase [Mucilaginibacter pankratovii]MBD1362700.1 metallophosphoesterase [Mucilaginibacter pankratovii]
MNSNLFIKSALISCLTLAPFFLRAQTGPVVNADKDNTVLNTPGPAAKVKDGDFSIAVMPDTQYYLAQAQLGGNFDMFKAQIDWIQKNQEKENIAYVAHMGDITEHGDNPVTSRSEWYLAKTALYGLESPVSIPYGLTVGNHDQFPAQYPVKGTTNGYNQYFGIKHFEGRPYYGGHYGTNNDSHYDLFTAGGRDFIVVFLEFDSHNEDQANLYSWANDVLKKNVSRKAIVVSHSILHFGPVTGSNTPQAPFNAEGKAIFEALKDNPNLFMMLSGHVGDNGEGYRVETVGGHNIKAFLSDYQSRPNGGNGLMRLYKFSVKKNELSVKTFSPYAHLDETDADSKFTVPLFD